MYPEWNNKDDLDVILTVVRKKNEAPDVCIN